MIDKVNQRDQGEYDINDPGTFLIVLRDAKPTQREALLAEWQSAAYLRGKESR